MLKRSILPAIMVLLGLAGGLWAQDATSARARELAAALDKEKYKKKENRYISLEIYIDIKNEAAAKTDKSAYSGSYETDGYKLDLKVASSGEAAGSGYDHPMGDGTRVRFELRDGRVDGAILSGTKVYENGETRKFEAVFVNRTVSVGQNKNRIEERETEFGLGFIEGGPVIAGNKETAGDSTNRVFLARKN